MTMCLNHPKVIPLPCSLLPLPTHLPPLSPRTKSMEKLSSMKPVPGAKMVRDCRKPRGFRGNQHCQQYLDLGLFTSRADSK